MEHILKEWANKICCKVEAFPSTYLGLPLRAKANSVKIWEPIIEKFEKRLAGWKSKLLGYGACFWDGPNSLSLFLCFRA